MVVTLRASMLRRMQRGFGVGAAELPGCAGLELAQGVVSLNPQEAVFEGMLAGWARQQRSRFLRVEATIGPRAALVRRLAGFAGNTRGSGSRPRRRRSSVTCGPGRGRWRSRRRAGTRPRCGWSLAFADSSVTRRCAELGSDEAAVRIGGLTDLERLGQNNADMRQTVVDRICAYILLSGHRYAGHGL
jgi:hypothetical protein